MPPRNRRSSAPSGAPRYPRTARLSETLREVIAEELVRIDDEALAFVTITKVDTDPEMNRATVYFDSLAGEEADEQIVDAFAAHRRRLQSSVGRQVRAKKTPILFFQPDEVLRAAERIERILRAEGTLPERPPEPETDDDAADTSADESGE
jgi:ribosome-binding factor A